MIIVKATLDDLYCQSDHLLIADRTDDTTFGAGTFSWQDPVHSWKAGPGEVMAGKFIYLFFTSINTTTFILYY